ncbi:lys-63-specific deubiquitinase BRCC36-like isoform X2 [Rhodamnia argentea]|uniref:Lys-63-specific deubiquitinase BRCC36-like isoform X2 n=1 Tax=Rhodamnia argentea TaxID=178133 RepID=A0ABM3HUS4_9MYRT|nr:lys-63-specific deubiquitinase BRCC36-like isoform X2 [Rhodamnia argentea]
MINEVRSKNGTSSTALIWGASPQKRSDRQKDRVETNPEQLAAASALAEEMTMSTGRTTRVIGWYHSHPHITVLPSHVDVRTQAMYQLLDSGFIGLIFSCFSEDINKVGRIQVIAFQSSDGKQSQISRPIPLSPVNRSSVIDLESSLSSSENLSARSNSGRLENPEEDTGDSRISAGANKGRGRSSDLGGFFANADTNYLGRAISVENYGNGNPSSSAIIPIDPMDMTESMQEAMHRSNLDMSGAEYVRKEVPLYVLPSSSLLNLVSPLTSFTDLQRVIFEEERAAYFEAMRQNVRDGKAHPLTFIHHTSTYQASMCKLIEYCLSPAIRVLQDRLRENEIRMLKLADEAKSLEMETQRGSDLSSGHRASVYSPRSGPSAPESSNMRSIGSPGSRSKKWPQ